MKKRPVKVYPKNRRNLDIHINTHTLNTVMENNENVIAEKITTLTQSEPLKLKAKAFAGGKYGLELTWQVNPNNPMHLDQVMLSLEKSVLKQMVKGFIENVIETAVEDGGLGGVLATAEDKAIKEATKGGK